MNAIVFYPVKLNTKTWSKISPAQYLGHLCEKLPESHPLCGLSVQRLWRATRPPWPYVSTRWVLIICPRLQWNASRSSWHEIIHRLTPCRLFVHGWLHTSSQCCSFMRLFSQSWHPDLNHRCRFTSTAGSHLSKIQKSGIQYIPWCNQVYSIQRC